MLSQKLNQQSKLKLRRRKIKQKLKELSKQLYNIESEMSLLNETIQKLEMAVAEGTDGEDD